MQQVRSCLGTVAMIFMFVTVFAGWGITVVLPLLGGEKPLADVGGLVLWTIVGLIMWRVTLGPGWGFGGGDTDARATESNGDMRVGAGTAAVPSAGTDAGAVAGAGEPRLPREWARGLAARTGLNDADVQAIVARAYTTRQQGATLPDRRHVFRAFEYTYPHEVKVVILGQDPYPRRGDADGLAFSVPAGVAIPRSLTRIFDNLEADGAVSFTRPRDGDLSRWARQGVLLLNSALTVREGEPGSHRDYWRDLTRGVLEVLNKRGEPIAFLLWGTEASAIADAVHIDEGIHRVIRSPHPGRDERAGYPRFADTHPFSAANSFLRSRGRGEVDWRL